jgi:hypothetical protein
MGMNWIYKLTKGELVDRMEQHHVPSEGTFNQLKQRLVHFMRENEAFFPECLQETSRDDKLEPSMAETNLEEDSGDQPGRAAIHEPEGPGGTPWRENGRHANGELRKTNRLAEARGRPLDTVTSHPVERKNHRETSEDSSPERLHRADEQRHHQSRTEGIQRTEPAPHRQSDRKDFSPERTRWVEDQYHHQRRTDYIPRSEAPLYHQEEEKHRYYSDRDQREDVRREYGKLKNYFPEQLPHHQVAPEYNVTDQIRKWGCHFDGENAVEFLERAEKLRRAYGFEGAQLLHGLPELLRGEGLQCFRSITPPKTWTEFKER